MITLEQRFLVLKYKDIDRYLTEELKQQLMVIAAAINLGRVRDHKFLLESVVIEDDWKIYDQVVELLEGEIKEKESVDKGTQAL